MQKFEPKEINLSVFAGIDFNHTLRINESDGFPIDLEEYSLSGFIYRLYDDIEDVKIPLVFNSISMKISKISSETLQPTRFYKYKILASKTNEENLVQYGHLYVIEESKL